MAYYNASELKSKLSGCKTRVLAMGKNEQKMIWIPKDEFFFVRKHYEIQKVPGVKTNKKSCWCLNTEYGKDNKKCMICNYVDELWKKWRSTTNKEEKLKIQAIINRLNGEYFYVNGIDMSDAELKFVAIKFTTSKVRDIMNVVEKHQIDRIKWLYKKTVTPMSNNKDKIGYVLTELIDDKDAIELGQKYDELVEREYEAGGLVDLENGFGKKQTEEELTSYLTAVSNESDEEESSSGVDVFDIAPDVKVNKSKTTTVDEMSLDDISMDESLSDDLSLDDLSLDDVEKMAPLTLDFIQANKNNRDMINPIIEYFNEKGFIKMEHDYLKDIKALYAYLKNNKVEVPENLVDDLIQF